MNSSALTLDTSDGRLVAEVAGPAEAPVVVCLPGMGDVRSAYRHLVPLVVDRGWRIATRDLPGHGESDAGAAPSQLRIGEHAAALVDHLRGPAIVVGHSFTPDSALVASQLSEAVQAVVCLAPWWHTPPISAPMRLVTGTLASSPWAWGLFYRSLHKAPPADLAAHVRRLRSSLRRRQGTATLRRMATGEGKDARDRLGATAVPVVVVMGDKDPDFRDPVAEAQAYADACGAALVMAPGVGHYPHAESPEVVMATVDSLAQQSGWTRRA